MLAARLMHRIEQQLGERLPLATLLQAPTIEQLAAVMQKAEGSSSWSSLVALQPQGSHAPFFCVHGVGGNVVGFRDLAKHLGPEQPFYALQPQGLDGKRECLTSIPQMAERYFRKFAVYSPKVLTVSVDIPSAASLRTRWPSSWRLKANMYPCWRCSIHTLEKSKRVAIRSRA